MLYPEDYEDPRALARSQLFTPSLAVWLFVVGLFAAGMATCAQAQDAPGLLVATERLAGPFRGSVILMAPFEDRHVGVILNRPTHTKLADLFPEHAPSRAVSAPIYLGGPLHSSSIFALVLAEQAPDPKSIPLGPGVWLVIERAPLDAIIEAKPNEARYFSGVVAWRPGELENELQQGMFALRPFDKSKLMRPDTSTLHEDLAPKKGQVES